MKNRRLVLMGVFGIIFLFWFLLTKNNFFHWDEWAFLTSFQQNPLNFLTKSYGEHYIPLNLLNHYVLFKIFGLNNLPFQLSVLFFHLLNCLLLYKILLKQTRNFVLSILGTLMFGISNAYVEDVIWSQGISNVASATFVFLAYYLYLLNPKSLKNLFLSALSLLVAPLFNDLAVLMPVAFLVMTFLDNFNFKKPKLSLSLPSLSLYASYALAFVLNLSVIFFFSHNAISHSAKFSLASLYRIPEFVLYGVLRGPILRFAYPGFHLINGAQETKTVLVYVVSAAVVALSSIVLLNWLKAKSTRHSRLVFLSSSLALLLSGYFAVSLGRANFGLSQAGISRYAYQPFFFLIILALVILSNYFSKAKSLIIFCCLFLVAVNAFAIFRFQTEFWSLMVGRDRQFIVDARSLFSKNKTICDAEVPGILPKVRLSSLWFLNSKNKFTTDCRNLQMDPKSEKIYERIFTDYQKKFD